MGTDRRAGIAVLLVGAAVLAGCLSLDGAPEADADPLEPAQAPVETWNASDEAQIGAVAGAGIDGGYAWQPGEDRCPWVALEILPGSGTQRLALEVTPEPAGNTAVGAYHELTLHAPDGEPVDARTWPGDELAFEVEDPATGEWTLAISTGAGLDAAWPVDARAAGEGQRPLDAFAFEDC